MISISEEKHFALSTNRSRFSSLYKAYLLRLISIIIIVIIFQLYKSLIIKLYKNIVGYSFAISGTKIT